jgi:hypothetical protein
MKIKNLYSILAMTALLGWLPPLLALLAVKFALDHGARNWPVIIFDTTFVGLYFALLGTGAYLYSRW